MLLLLELNFISFFLLKTRTFQAQVFCEESFRKRLLAKYNYSEPISHSVFLPRANTDNSDQVRIPLTPEPDTASGPCWRSFHKGRAEYNPNINTLYSITTTSLPQGSIWFTYCIFKKYTAKNWDISQLSNTCKIHTKPWVQSPSTENKDLKNPIECLLIKDLSGSLQRESLSLQLV